jgi:hypothetical protein
MSSRFFNSASLVNTFIIYALALAFALAFPFLGVLLDRKGLGPNLRIVLSKSIASIWNF